MIKRAIAYLSVILAIFARDVKRVMRNPVALVIVLGVLLLAVFASSQYAASASVWRQLRDNAE